MASGQISKTAELHLFCCSQKLMMTVRRLQIRQKIKVRSKSFCARSQLIHKTSSSSMGMITRACRLDHGTVPMSLATRTLWSHRTRSQTLRQWGRSAIWSNNCRRDPFESSTNWRLRTSSCRYSMALRALSSLHRSRKISLRSMHCTLSSSNNSRLSNWTKSLPNSL